MVALFRLVELDRGCILIDGVDISQLGLDKLRRSMAIIPQDPVLFSGTVRSNLDPFQEYSDDAIWAVLKKAHLVEHILKLEGQLLASVAENGENFSVGQRCLVCLARAMLKDAKILIMDGEDRSGRETAVEESIFNASSHDSFFLAFSFLPFSPPQRPPPPSIWRLIL